MVFQFKISKQHYRSSNKIITNHDEVSKGFGSRLYLCDAEECPMLKIDEWPSLVQQGFGCGDKIIPYDPKDLMVNNSYLQLF